MAKKTESKSGSKFDRVVAGAKNIKAKADKWYADRPMVSKAVDTVSGIGMGSVGKAASEAKGAAKSFASKLKGKTDKFAGKFGVERKLNPKLKELSKKAPEQKARLKHEKETKDYLDYKKQDVGFTAFHKKTAGKNKGSNYIVDSMQPDIRVDVKSLRAKDSANTALAKKGKTPDKGTKERMREADSMGRYRHTKHWREYVKAAGKHKRGETKTLE